MRNMRYATTTRGAERNLARIGIGATLTILWWACYWLFIGWWWRPARWATKTYGWRGLAVFIGVFIALAALSAILQALGLMH